MRANWFKALGWINSQIAWQGVLVTLVALVALAFSLQVFLAVDRNSHSVSDTFYGIFPYLVPTWGLVYWVASKTSRPNS